MSNGVRSCAQELFVVAAVFSLFTVIFYGANAAANNQIFKGWSWHINQPLFDSAEEACNAYPPYNYTYSPNTYCCYFKFTGALANLTYPQYGDCQFAIVNPTDPLYNDPSKSRFTVYPYFDTVSGKNAGNACPTTPNPITIGIGNKFLAETDSNTSTQTLTLRRYYNSISPMTTSFGASWRHSYKRQIFLSTSLAATVRRPDGKSLNFQLSGSTWIGGADIAESTTPTAAPSMPWAACGRTSAPPTRPSPTSTMPRAI